MATGICWDGLLISLIWCAATAAAVSIACAEEIMACGEG